MQKIDLLSRLTLVYYITKNLSTFFAKPSIFTINSSKFPQNDESRRQGHFRSAIDFYKIKILLIRKLRFLRAGKPRVQKASVVQLKTRFEACILVRRDEVLQKAPYRALLIHLERDAAVDRLFQQLAHAGVAAR